MPFFAKKDDQWVVLDDKKNVLYSDPDREKALAFFKTIGTKPENTCPHPKIERKIRGTPPEVRIRWRDDHRVYWPPDIQRGDMEWYRVCVTCGKEIE